MVGGTPLSPRLVSLNPHPSLHPQPAVDPRELTFLALQHLRWAAPEAAAALEAADAAAGGTLLPLPTAPDPFGGPDRRLSLDGVASRHPGVGIDALARLVAGRGGEGSVDDAHRHPGLVSLLEAGGGLAGARPARPARASPGRPDLLLRARPAGLGPQTRAAASIAPPATVATSLRHTSTVRGHRYSIYCLAWSPDGRVLITGSDDGLVKLWGARTAALLRTCRAHRSEVTDLAISADGRLVTSGGCDGDLHVWRLAAGPAGLVRAHASAGGVGSCAATLTGHTAPITFVEYAPGCTPAGQAGVLLSSSFDGSVRLWDGGDGDCGGGGEWRGVEGAGRPLFPLAQHRTALVVLRPGPDFGLAGWRGGGGGGGARRRLPLPPPPPPRVVWDEEEGTDSDDGGRGRGTRRSARRAAAVAVAAEAERAAGNARGRRRHGRGRREASPSDSEGDLILSRPSLRARPAGAAAAAAAAAAAHEEADDDHPPGPATAMMVCGFSPDGASILAGGEDGGLYVWGWGCGWAGPGAPTGAVGGGPPADRRGGGAAFYAPVEGVGALPPPPPPPYRMRGDGGGGGGGDAGLDPPVEVARLGGAGGHGGANAAGAAPSLSLLLLQFSRAGDAIATGSKDGRVRVWRRTGGPAAACRRVAAQGAPPPPAWEAALDLDAAPAPSAPARPAPARPRAAHHRPAPASASVGVNQIAWTADDRAVLAAAADASIRVWCAATGAPLARLAWHTAPVHVLEPHPFDPAVLMSASYDGTAAVWEVPFGKGRALALQKVGGEGGGRPAPDPPVISAPLASWNTRATYPALGGVWPDPVPIVDGHWAPDGTAFAVSDVAGQWHSFESGPPSAAAARSRYDQFQWRDYDRLVRVDLRDLDVRGRPVGRVAVPIAGADVPASATVLLDAATGELPWVADARRDNGLVDALGGAYPPSYVAAARARRLSDLTLDAARVEAENAPPRPATTLPRAARAAPPTLTSSAWLVNEEEEGTDEAVIQAAVRRAEVRLARSEAAVAAAVAAPRPRRPRPAFGAGGSSDEEEVEAALHAAQVAALLTSSLPPIPARMLEAGVGAAGLAFAQWVDEEEEEAGGGRQNGDGRWRAGAGEPGPGRIRRRPSWTTSDDDRSDGGGSGDDDDTDDEDFQGGADNPAAPGGDHGSSSSSEEDDDDDDEDDEEGGGTTSGSSPSSSSDGGGRRRITRAARRAGGGGGAGAPVRRGRGRAVRRRVVAEREHAWTSSGDETDGDEGGAGETTDEMDEDGEPGAGGGRLRAAAPPPPSWPGTLTAPRPPRAYAWLASAATAPGAYTPQVGDACVYLRDGHAAAVAAARALGEADPDAASFSALLAVQGPAAVGLLRPAEPATVTGITFSIAHPTPAAPAGVTRPTVRLLLERAGRGDPLAGAVLDLTLPAPDSGAADFVIPRALFEATVLRWSVSDRVAVWFAEAAAATDARGWGGGARAAADPARPAGRFFEGTVAADRRQPSAAALAAAGGPAHLRDANAAEVAANPWAAAGLWERFAVAWTGEGGGADGSGDGAADPASPWELWPPGTSPEAARGVIGPGLDAYTRGAAADAVAAALGEDRFALFASSPLPPGDAWVPGPGSSVAAAAAAAGLDPGATPVSYSAAIPLPLSLEEVGARVAAGFYRQAAAFGADADLIASNAAAFNGAGSEIALAAADLAARLKAAVGLAPGTRVTHSGTGGELRVRLGRRR